MTLTAACANCASWTKSAPDPARPTLAGPGWCHRGLTPPEGEPLCQAYEASPAFKQANISAMLKDKGPMAMPVKLVGGRRSAKEFRRAR